MLHPFSPSDASSEQGDNPGVSITFELDSCQSGYGSDGSVNCVACPAGKFSYKARCFECSSGTYQPAAMATTCLVCGAGTYTPFQAAGFTSCLTCQPGTYSDDKKARCENCNAGTYNPSYGGAYYASCLPCSAGNYSLDQATACIQCQAGKYQVRTAYVIGIKCIALFVLKSWSRSFPDNPPASRALWARHLPTSARRPSKHASSAAADTFPAWTEQNAWGARFVLYMEQ